MSYEQMIEDQEYEFNARYDYISEAFGDLGDDPEIVRAEMEDCANEWDAAMTEAYGPVVCPRSADDHREIPF